MESVTPPARDGVLAVLVARVDDQHLPDTLRALSSQELPPSRLTVVLVGQPSADDSSELARVENLLAEYPGLTTTAPPRVIAHPEAENFAEAVNAAVDGDEPWLWLLHGDGAPQPSCLDRQLRLALTSQKIGAVGVKQVAWNDHSDLLEVGIRATRSARRVPEIEPNEVDQGQLDGREDVLGVGSAAMLVRRAAFESVGHLDPALGPYGDGLELSRRLWAGGWRVVVEPRAVIAHARASLDAPTSVTFASRRSAQLYNAAVAAPALILVFLVLGQLIVAPVRAVGRLVTKDVRHALPEVVGAVRFWGMIPAVIAARRRLRVITKAPRGTLRTLEERPREVWLSQRRVRHSQADAAAMADMPDPLELRELAAARRARRVWATVTLMVSLIGSLAGLIPLIGRGVLTGGALLPDVSSFRDLAAMAASSWLPTGDGLATPVDALWLVFGPLVLLTTPLGGSLGAVASAVVMSGIVLAAMVAFWASGRIVHSAPLRALAAVVWGFAPPLLAAVSVGQVAGIVWHVLAPALVACALDTWRTPSVRALGRTALLLAIMSAAAPVTALLILPLLAMTLWRRAWRWLWIPVPALALLAPTIISAVRGEAGWKVLLASPGQPLNAPVSVFNILTFSPVVAASGAAPGSTMTLAALGELAVLLPIIATVLLVVPAVALLARREHRGWILGGWIAVGLGIAWAVGCALTDVAVVPQMPTLAVTTAWPGIALSFSILGLWLAFLGGGENFAASLRAPGWRRIAAGCAGVSVALSCVGYTGVWAEKSLRGDIPLESASANPLPAVAVVEQHSDYRSRVLEIVPSDEGSVISVLRGPGAQLHESGMMVGLMDLSAKASGLDEAREDLARAVTNPDGAEAAEIFGEHAISHVFVPASDKDAARKALISRLGGIGGLEFVTENASGAFWRVRVGNGPADAASTSRLRIEDGVNTVSLTSGRIGSRLDIPDGAAGRRLVLSERADAGWRATLDGVELKPISDGWRQMWELPSHGGHLRIDYGGTVPWMLYGQAAILSAALVLALPTRRRKQMWV